MIRSRSEACQTLGISVAAGEAEIRAAYKALVKLYHPDAGILDDVSRYNQVVEAYSFLCPKNGAKPQPVTGRVVGGNSNKATGQFRKTASKKDYESWEKKVKRQQERKAREFKEKTENYTAKLKKQEDDYRRAMEAIDAIRAARAIESMVWANGLEKDERKDK